MISEFTLTHAEGAEAVERECFGSPWGLSALKAAACGQGGAVGVVALEPGGRVTGYALARTIAEDEAELLRVAVLPELRREGRAAALLGALISLLRARGIGRIHIEVRASNAPAIALYEKLGFRRTGTRPGYYTRPEEPALLMQLKLRQEGTVTS